MADRGEDRFRFGQAAGAEFTTGHRAFIRLEHFACLSDLVDSAVELFFLPGTRRLGHGGEAHVDWSGSPRIVLDLELRPPGVTVYFQLTLSEERSSVAVNYVSFEKPGEDPEHNTVLLETVIEEARIRRTEPLAYR